jgi:hypothetical protein
MSEALSVPAKRKPKKFEVWGYEGGEKFLVERCSSRKRAGEVASKWAGSQVHELSSSELMELDSKDLY